MPTPLGPECALALRRSLTNSGWPPGAITLDTDDYRSLPGSTTMHPRWRLTSGRVLSGGGGAIEAPLASPRAAGTHEAANGPPKSEASARQGLRTLGEIAMLLLIAAALSVASALGAVIWQRRAKLASLRIQGFDYRQLWRALLLESLILLSIGSLDGVLLGIYGHALASRWLELTTGFSAPFSLAGWQILETFLLVAGMAIAVIAVPGLKAAKVPANMGLQE